MYFHSPSHSNVIEDDCDDYEMNSCSSHAEDSDVSYDRPGFLDKLKYSGKIMFYFFMKTTLDLDLAYGNKSKISNDAVQILQNK